MKNKICSLIVCILLATIVSPVIAITNTINLTILEEDSLSEYYKQKLSDLREQYPVGVWYKMAPNVVNGTFDERERHAMAYYESVDRTILFSGKRKVGVPEINDTWAYDYTNNTWTNLTPNFVGGSLSEREDFQLVYDSAAEKIILFGGSDGGEYYNDTWVYNYTDNTWYNMTPTISYENGTLRGGDGYAIAYDSNADRTILLGGYNGAVWTNETWEYNYNTNTWNNLTPTMTTSDPFIALLDGQLVYDSQADCCILFGGQNIYGRLNETWEYNHNNNTWTDLTSTMRTIGGWLEPRNWHRMVYDSQASQIVMFSGNRGQNDHINDTWVYNYTVNTWYNINYSTYGGILWPREASGMAYDSKNKKTILMGGYYHPEPINDMLDDTWVFEYEINTSSNQAPNTPVKPSGPTWLNPDKSGIYNTSTTDPDGDWLQYRFDWDANGSHNYSKWTKFVPSGIQVNLSQSWSIGGTYCVKAQARDYFYLNTSEWSTGLSVVINNAPNNPSDPDPFDGEYNVDVKADLSWNCSDPDGDNLTYDVYFGKTSSPPMVSNNQSENWYDPGTMEYKTNYYWKIVAWDEYGLSTEGTVWDFTTGSEPNNPPYPPSNPSPENGSTDVDINADLSWEGGDPDEEDTVVYDVIFEANDTTPDKIIAHDISKNTSDPGTLEHDTIYYWRIFAKDNHGACTWSPIWHFTTEENMPPDPPIIDGPDKGSPGVSYEYGFTSFDPDGHDIATYIIDWGNGILEPHTGPYESGVEILVSHTWDEKGTYIIKAKAVDIYGANSSWSEFEVTIPRPRTSSYLWYEWFLDQFPLLEKLLNLIKHHAF